jgi:hypothetical protein
MFKSFLSFFFLCLPCFFLDVAESSLASDFEASDCHRMTKSSACITVWLGQRQCLTCPPCFLFAQVGYRTSAALSPPVRFSSVAAESIASPRWPSHGVSRRRPPCSKSRGSRSGPAGTFFAILLPCYFVWTLLSHGFRMRPLMKLGRGG